MGIGMELVALLKKAGERLPAPRVRALHLPPPDRVAGKDGEFCALELEGGSLGLGFVLLGDTLQRPPDFSAKRFQGERGYNLVRWGEPVVMTPVPVRIDAIELLALNGPEATLRVACGKGTYIRSLAHDIGQALGCGAWLSGLRRTRSGAYSVDDALTVEQWSDWLDKWAAERQPTDTQKG